MSQSAGLQRIQTCHLELLVVLDRVPAVGGLGLVEDVLDGAAGGVAELVGDYLRAYGGGPLRLGR